MLLVRAPTHLTVRFVSAAPSVTTGIEHAIKFKEIGKRYQQDFKDYKCSDYLHYNRLSFYDFETKMSASRVPQPTNKKPDVMPQVKQQK